MSGQSTTGENTLAVRLQLAAHSLSAHLLPVFLVLFLLLVAAGMAWLAYTGVHWIFYVMGGVALLGAAIVAITLISSLPHTYRQKEVELFGKNITGTVTGKRIEKDRLIHENVEAGWTSVEVDLCLVAYQYTLDNRYTGEMVLENRQFYDKINIGDQVPLQVLYHKPHVSRPRLVKLGKQYGLSRGESK